MTRWKPDAEARLIKAAITLFDRQGYDETTVAQIAEAVGLTKRTFFRYFADKREVLFSGSEQLESVWVEAVAAAPTGPSPLVLVAAGFGPIGDLFADRHPFARMRAGVVAANPELQERELIKLQNLAKAIARALVDRGVDRNDAILAAQAGVTVFHVAFARWVEQEQPAAFARLLDASLRQLRSVTAASS